MSYIIGLIVVVLFFVALHYFTELNYSQKLGISLGVAAVIGGAYGYNRMSDAQRQHTLEIELKYQQNKTVVCEGIDVNKTYFSYSVGTQTFIGREGTAHYGRMLNASKCQ